MFFPQIYSPGAGRDIVGGVFERRLQIDLGTKIHDRNATTLFPDLCCESFSFAIEVKASATINGGVVRARQLGRFQEGIFMKQGEVPLKYEIPLFYAFVYHGINKNLEKRFPLRRNLQRALHRHFKSAYIFPVEIIRELYATLNPISSTKLNDSFVQVQERKAREVFEGIKFWDKFTNTSYDDYTQTQKGKYHFLTRKEEQFPFDLSNI